MSSVVSDDDINALLVSIEEDAARLDLLCKDHAETLHKKYGLPRRTCTALVYEFGHLTEPKDWVGYVKVLRIPGIGTTGAASVHDLVIKLGLEAPEASDELAGLSSMCKNALRFAGLSSRDQILEAASDGSIYKIYNIGTIGISRIFEWLGLDAPSSAQLTAKIDKAISLLEMHGYRVIKPNEAEYSDHIKALEAAIIAADENRLITEGIGLVSLLGNLPEAETVSCLLEKKFGITRG
jgi:hypothetical protein